MGWAAGCPGAEPRGLGCGPLDHAATSAGPSRQTNSEGAHTKNQHLIGCPSPSSLTHPPPLEKKIKNRQSREQLVLLTSLRSVRASVSSEFQPESSVCPSGLSLISVCVCVCVGPSEDLGSDPALRPDRAANHTLKPFQKCFPFLFLFFFFISPTTHSTPTHTVTNPLPPHTHTQTLHPPPSWRLNPPPPPRTAQ